MYKVAFILGLHLIDFFSALHRNLQYVILRPYTITSSLKRKSNFTTITLLFICCHLNIDLFILIVLVYDFSI